MLYVFETYWPEPALGIENPVANAGANPKRLVSSTIVAAVYIVALLYK